MNENYLWDKSGTDAEIEELEEMLSVFRHEGEAPVVGASNNVIEFPKRSFSRQYVYAIAASLALAFLAGVWFLQARKGADVAAVTPVVEKKAVDKQLPQPVSENVPAMQESKPEQASAVRVRSTAKLRAVKAVHTKRTPSRKASRVEGLTAKVTKEEQEAYDQVLLALSITSSKLQVVRDTISRSEASTDKGDR